MTPVEIIQLALAPVFLLVAIGQLMNVVSLRLARVIDRIRALIAEYEAQADASKQARMRHEVNDLFRRMRFANVSVNLLVTSAVAVCGVVVVLFLDGLVSWKLEAALIVLFTLSVLLITGGVIAFLIEVTIATATLSRDPTILRCLGERGEPGKLPTD
ncbi:MAG: DUF2721 domain-containing protein [Pseudomonadota bacterium]